MRRLAIALMAGLLVGGAKAQQNIYSFVIDSVANGSQINFSVFQGSKILIVNMASQDSSFNQYGELQQLSQQYQGSLFVIAIPTNSFGSEPGDSTSLGSLYAQSPSGLFPVASKLSVNGADISTLYQWLTQQSQNGVMDSNVKMPGYKYLINSQGNLIGFFSPMIRPMSVVMANAISNSQ